MPVVVAVEHLVEVLVEVVEEALPVVEPREALRLLSSLIDTKVSLLLVVRKIYSSPRTLFPAKLSMAKNEFLSKELMAPKLNTVSGTLSDPRLLLVSSVVLTIFTSLLERRSFTSVLPLEHPSPTLPMLLVLRAPSTPLSSLTVLAVI